MQLIFFWATKTRPRSEQHPGVLAVNCASNWSRLNRNHAIKIGQARRIAHAVYGGPVEDYCEPWSNYLSSVDSLHSSSPLTQGQTESVMALNRTRSFCALDLHCLMFVLHPPPPPPLLPSGVVQASCGAAGAELQSGSQSPVFWTLGLKNGLLVHKHRVHCCLEMLDKQSPVKQRGAGRRCGINSRLCLLWINSETQWGWWQRCNKAFTVAVRGSLCLSRSPRGHQRALFPHFQTKNWGIMTRGSPVMCIFMSHQLIFQPKF